MLKASSPVQGKDHNLSWKPLHYVSPILESCPGILHDIRDSLRATSSQSTAGLRVRGALQSGQRRREKKLKWNKTIMCIWHSFSSFNNRAWLKLYLTIVKRGKLHVECVSRLLN